MKLITSIITILIAGFSYANEAYLVKSKIQKVVVYQQGAQISRQGTYSISKGITEIKIQGISPQIDPNTLQIKSTGKVVILDSKHTINYPEPVKADNNLIPPKIKKEIIALEDSLFDLSYDQLDIQNQIDVLTKEKSVIENNTAVNGNGKANDSIALLQTALAYYNTRVNAINKSLLKLNRTKILLARKQTNMNTRLASLNQYNSNNQFIANTNTAPNHEIIITLSANENVSGKINVTYLVNGAGWTPLYDLRSNNTGKTIDLTYKAQVYQNTGIDWNKVPLNLSTNNPYENKTKPQLNPWYLDYASYIRQPTNTNVLEKKRDKSRMGVRASEPGVLYSESADEEENEESLDAYAFMSTIEQLVSVEYSINLPYTIKSDNQKNMVLVKTSKLKTNYLYYTAPKLDQSVYLIAQITDLDKLNLIPGNATIFHDGSYLGNTYINPASMRDTMDLSLGKTNNISVKRTLMKNNTKERVIGDKIVKTFAYQIEVNNRNSEQVELLIEDQVPLSRNDEIEVEIEKIDKGKLNKITGIISWDSKVKPNGSNRYEIIYTVKYEKNKNINLASN